MKSKLTIIVSIFLLTAPIVYAATTLEVGIPGQVSPGDTVSGIPEYIKYIYLFVMGFVGIAGFASIVFWGAVWAGSGVVDKKAAALGGIKNALYGIGIALTAFIILNTINPDLTVIKAPNVGNVKIESRNINMSPQQIKYQDDENYCGNNYNTMYINSCSADLRCGVKNVSWGDGKICVSKEEAECDKYTQKYQGCNSNQQCMGEAIRDCSQYIPTPDGKCYWLGNSCIYGPNSK